MRIRKPLASAAPLVVAAVLGGCSLSRTAVDVMTPILDNTVDAALRCEDPRLVGDGLPTSLLLLEGMMDTHPGNREIATLASMLYFSYAFAWVEPVDRDRAAWLYGKGLDAGWAALRDDDLAEAIRSGPFDTLDRALADADEDDAEALLWIAANWGMRIQLRLDDPREVAGFARVLPVAERVAALDETLFWGMPRILLGAMHASRPVMLGGDPDRARAEFERAFAISDRNLLLAQVFFAQFWCVQAFDVDAWNAALREVLDAPPGRLPEAELLNRIARQRAEALVARTEEIFE